MRLFIPFFLLCMTLVHLWATSDEYYQMDEYLQKYNQTTVSQDFIQTVQHDAQAIKQRNKQIKIVMVYPGNQISEYWRKSKLSFEKRLKELNIEYELHDFFTKPAVEIKEQSKHLLLALKQNPDYLIFTLDAKKHASFIERILVKGTTKLILQNITTPLREWDRKQPFLYVGFDHFIGSKMLAEYYIQQTQGEGNYAVLYGPRGYVSYMRGTKFVEYVSHNSHLKLIHEYYTDFDKQKAKEATLDLLRINPSVKFIYACSTDIALGVIEALEEKNLLGTIRVNGWGGGSSELKAIEEKKMDITVMRMNDDNGVAMAEAIKLDLLGQKALVPTLFSGAFTLVDKEIEPNHLEQLKQRAFRYTLHD